MPRMKSIVFQGKRIRVRNVSNLRRHAEKQEGTPTGLSREGIITSIQKGYAAPKNLALKGYHSDYPRAMHSLDSISLGHQAKFGKSYEKLRQRKSLSFDVINPKVFDKFVDKFVSPEVDKPTAWVKAMRAWIDGKADMEGIPDWKKVTDGFILQGLRFGQYASERGAKNKLFEHLSHVPIVDLVFERLTGEKFDVIGKGKYTDPLEAVNFYHVADGRIILEYKGKRFDVTEKYNEIVSAYKAKKKEEAKKYREKKE